MVACVFFMFLEYYKMVAGVFWLVPGVVARALLCRLPKNLDVAKVFTLTCLWYE